MSNKVIPAIIPQSFSQLETIIATRLPWAKEIQVDILDGIFVPFTSWPFTERTLIVALNVPIATVLI